MSAGPPFLAIHQYNPASAKAQGQLLEFLAELNQAVLRTRLVETEYLAWRVTGKPAGPFGYVFGSLWPDRGTYDAVHEHEAFRAVVERCESSGLELFESEVSNRYHLLNPPAGGRPPVLGDLVGHLRMEAHVLDSAQEEQRLVAILEEGSAAIADSGHPETRYDLWRVAEKPNGPFKHLFGSLWASREAYDAVHAHPAHQAFMKRHGEALDSLLEGGVGNRYDRIPVK